MPSLNNRIVVRRRNLSQGPGGQPLVAWEDVAQLWADVKYESGAEAIRADQPITGVKASIKVRVRGGLEPGMQVQQINRATKFHVVAILPDERNRLFMYLVCEAEK